MLLLLRLSTMSPNALFQMDFLLVFSVFVSGNIIIVDVVVTLVFVVVDSGIVVDVAVVIIADVVCCLMKNSPRIVTDNSQSRSN